MPRQLTDLEDTIRKKGRELLFTEGYSAFSMRRIAGDCGIAVGTLYNYVRSKEDLLARIALEDWQKAAQRIREKISPDTDFTDGMVEIYREITEFRNMYTSMFSLYSAQGGSGGTVAAYHPQLHKEVCGFIEPLLPALAEDKKSAVLPVLGELILSCATHSEIGEEKLKAFLSMFCIGGKK